MIDRRALVLFLAVSTVLVVGSAPRPRARPASVGGSVVLSGAPAAHRGEPISVSLKNAELVDVLRLVARVGRLNLVVDDDLAGKTITLELDRVPWDQALRIVLEAHGLGAEWSGNVLHVDGLGDLAEQARDEGRLREARQRVGDLVTVARTLSHANAADAEALVRAELSERGSVTLDRRTNTLVIRDTPEVVARLTRVIDGEADRPVGPAGAVRATTPAPAAPARDGRVLASWHSWLLECEASFVDQLGLPGSVVRPVPGSDSLIARAELDREGLAAAKLVLGRLTQREQLSVLGAQPFALGPGGGTSLALGELGSGEPVSLDLGLERDGGRFVLTFRGRLSRSGLRLPLRWHGPVDSAWLVELSPAPGARRRVLLIEPEP